MKLYRLIIASIAISATITSCKPIYKCGEAKPAKKLFLPKNILAVINERDSLCRTVSDRENEISNLNKDIEDLNKDLGKKIKSLDELNKDYKKLEEQYDHLSSEKISQAESFNLSMKQKSAELAEKEALLSEREKALSELQKVIAKQDSITNRLNEVIRKALLGFKSDELSVEMKNGKVYVSLSDKLLFKSGSATIEEKGVQAIKVLADVLNKNSEIDILVEGHTDNIPIKTAIYKDNWDLSVVRATSIVRILTDEYKVAPSRLTASGKGEFQPKESNSTPEGRTKNRRTEIILSPKLDEIMKIIKTN